MAMKLRIIIADDDPIMRLLTRSLLASENKVEVVGEAINGLEALKLAESLRPDIICMDMNMPIMTGLEATRHKIGRASCRERVS
jgi:chemotaxis response regulator CheB